MEEDYREVRRGCVQIDIKIREAHIIMNRIQNSEINEIAVAMQKTSHIIVKVKTNSNVCWMNACCQSCS